MITSAFQTLCGWGLQGMAHSGDSEGSQWRKLPWDPGPCAGKERSLWEDGRHSLAPREWAEHGEEGQSAHGTFRPFHVPVYLLVLLWSEVPSKNKHVNRTGDTHKACIFFPFCDEKGNICEGKYHSQVCSHTISISSSLLFPPPTLRHPPSHTLSSSYGLSY